MLPGAARITQRDTVYLIQDPVTALCVRLHCVPAEGQAAPRIIPRLAPRAISTWFLSYEQAAEAFARFIGVQPLEIVRSDAA